METASSWVNNLCNADYSSGGKGAFLERETGIHANSINPTCYLGPASGKHATGFAEPPFLAYWRRQLHQRPFMVEPAVDSIR